MPITHVLIISVAFAMLVAFLEWRALSGFYRRRMAVANERHRDSQRTATSLLRQCRLQIAQLQQRAAEAGQAAQAAAAARPVASSAAAHSPVNRSGIESIAAPSRRQWPSNMFADTVVQEMAPLAAHQPGARGFADTVVESERSMRSPQRLGMH